MGADETATRGTDESVPYDAIFVPAKHYNGTGKPVPYKVRCKTQQRTCVTRGNHGFCQCLEPGYQRYAYP